MKLKKSSNMKQIYLGQKVKTPHGEGIAVLLKMDSNPLYFRPETAEVVVRYNEAIPFITGGSWYQFTYRFTEVEPID